MKTLTQKTVCGLIINSKKLTIMKKYLFLLSLSVIIFLAGCAKEQNAPEVVENTDYNTVLTAVLDSENVESKASVSDLKMTWNNLDKISVYTSEGRWTEFTYTGNDGVTTAAFKGNLNAEESVAYCAVYPAVAATGAVEVKEGAFKSVNLSYSSEYTWKEAEVLTPMVAIIGDDATSLTFKNAGGALAFDVVNVPQQAKAFTLTADGISGDVKYYARESDPDNYYAGRADRESKTVKFTFEQAQDAMKFYVPVPCGTYDGFTMSFLDADNNEIAAATKVNTASNQVVRRTIVSFTQILAGDTIYVSADGTGDGSSWASAASLDAALAKAKEGDVLQLKAGEYKPTTEMADGFSDKSFLVTKYITIKGGYAGTDDVQDAETNITKIDADGGIHAMVVAPVADARKYVNISGITFTGAISPDTEYDSESAALTANAIPTINGHVIRNNVGGGLYTTVNANIVNCCLTGNTTNETEYKGNYCSSGQGLYIAGGKNVYVNVVGSKFSDNKGMMSAAILVNATAAIKNCTFSDNSAKYAGAVSVHVPSNIVGCTFSGNEAEAHGGALRAFEALSVYDSEFLNNEVTSANGGAFTNTRAQVLISGCTFKGNSAAGNGGAIYNHGQGTLTIENSTFGGSVDGEANTGKNGGAVYNEYSPQENNTSQGKVVLNECKFYYNSATALGGAVYNYGNILTDAGSTFASNNGLSGGAIFAKEYVKDDVSLPAKTTIEGSVFTSNSATGGSSNDYEENSGGALVNQSSVMIVKSSAFANNSAYRAGAILSNDCTANNTTLIGKSQAYTYIYNSVFDGNNASEGQGEHIRLWGKSRFAAVNSTFVNTDSEKGSIRIRANVKDAIESWIISCTFKDNESALYNQNGKQSVYNTLGIGKSTQATGSNDVHENQTNTNGYFYSSAFGKMKLDNGTAVTNQLYDQSGNATTLDADIKLEDALSGFDSTLGVCKAVAAPALEGGMTADQLSDLGETLSEAMPDFETVYLTQDQKGNKRTAAIMGAYVGE